MGDELLILPCPECDVYVALDTLLTDQECPECGEEYADVSVEVVDGP